MRMPTRSAPGGCVIALIGLISWIYTALCGVALWRAWHAEQLSEKSAIIKTLAIHGSVSLALGLILVVVGWRLAIEVPPYDHSDPKEPKMKWR